MTLDEYTRQAQLCANLVDKGDYDGGLAALRPLIDGDLPDLDKSIMAVNMATVLDRKGLEAEALQWYDYGIGMERPHSRCFVAESKAEYLVRKGRYAEAAAIYAALLPEPFLQMQDRERITHNLAAARHRAG